MIAATQTIAQQFEVATKGKYPTPSLYRSAMGPGVFAPKAEKKAAVVQYEITFTDGSKTQVIMTHAQYNGIRRSVWEKILKTIGGQGYRQLIVKN